MAAPDVAAVERGLATSWVRQALWSDRGTVHRVGGLLVVLSGVPDQTQQVAVVEGTVTDPGTSLTAAEALFADAGWNPAVDLVAGAHPRLEEELRHRGYRVVARRPGMVRELTSLPDGARRVADVRLATLADRDVIVELQSRAFHLDRRLAGALLPERMFTDHDVDVLVATAVSSGEVVASATVHLDGDLAGLVGAGVEPRHQRRGVGAALTLAAMRRAAGSGASSMWLQATEPGESLYRRLDFVAVGRCDVWLRRPRG